MFIRANLPIRALRRPLRVGAALVLACLLPACANLRTSATAQDSAVPRVIERDLSGAALPAAADASPRAPR